jgi:hypothetical protein
MNVMCLLNVKNIETILQPIVLTHIILVISSIILFFIPILGTQLLSKKEPKNARSV